MKKKQCGRQFWNAVEREPVETKVLNPTASEASYKPKQCSYRKTKLKYFFLIGGILIGGILSGGFYPGTAIHVLRQVYIKLS